MQVSAWRMEFNRFTDCVAVIAAIKRIDANVSGAVEDVGREKARRCRSILVIDQPASHGSYFVADGSWTHPEPGEDQIGQTAADRLAGMVNVCQELLGLFRWRSGLPFPSQLPCCQPTKSLLPCFNHSGPLTQTESFSALAKNHQ